jgi:transcriptional regulator with XRE-family HTH domain
MSRLELKPILRIKQERLRRGWTQLQLAVKSRVSPAEISRIESGRTTPFPIHAKRLSKVLGIPEGELQQEVQPEAEIA